MEPGQPGQPGQPGAAQPGGQPPGAYGQPQPGGYGQAPGGQAPAANPAQTPSIILLVCAAIFAIGLFTGSWATASEGRLEIGAGLFGFEGCQRGHCESIDWDKGAKRLNIPSDVSTFRIVGLIAGFLALGALGMAGGMGLSRNTGKIPVRPIEIVLGVASGTLTYFAFRLAFSDRDVDFGPGFSAFLAVGALIAAGFVLRNKIGPLVRVEQGMAAFATAQPAMGQAPPQVAQAMAPAQPQAMAPAQPQAAPAAGQAPACPTCGAASQYVEAYQRYYCASCQQYL